MDAYQLTLNQNSDNHLAIRVMIVNDFTYQYRLDNKVSLGKITWATLAKGDGTGVWIESNSLKKKEEESVHTVLEDINQIQLKNQNKLQLIGNYFKATLIRNEKIEEPSN